MLVQLKLQGDCPLSRCCVIGCPCRSPAKLAHRPARCPQRREEEKRREQHEGQRMQRIRQRIEAAGREGEAQQAAATAVPSDSDVEEI